MFTLAVLLDCHENSHLQNDFPFDQKIPPSNFICFTCNNLLVLKFPYFLLIFGKNDASKGGYR